MAVDFVHLGARSDYSIGESVARVEHLVRVAAQDAQSAVALCDLMTLAGAPQLNATARHLGIDPIFGLEVRVLDPGPTVYPSECPRARLLATNDTGWRRLVALSNLAQCRIAEGLPPHLRWDEFLAHPDGLLYLIGGTRCGLAAELARGDIDAAEARMDSLLARVPLEQIALALPAPTTPEGARTCRLLVAVAGHYDLRVVAVPEVNSAQPEDDLAWCLLRRELAGLDERPVTLGDLVRPQDRRTNLAAREDVAAWYAEYPEAVANTVAIAAECRFEFPRAGTGFPSGEFQRGVDAESFIWNTAFERAGTRYGELPARWRERLNHEFREINEAGLANAIVCLSRLSEVLDERGILRGPGAGVLTNSLVASLLGITQLDPLPFDLPYSLPEGALRRIARLQLEVPTAQTTQAGEALAELFGGRCCAVGRWQRFTTVSALERVLELAGLDPRRAAQSTRLADWKSAMEDGVLEAAGSDPDPSWPLAGVPAQAWLVRRIEGRVRALKHQNDEFTFWATPREAAMPCAVLPDGTTVSQWDADALDSAGFGRIAFAHPPLLDQLAAAARWVRECRTSRVDPLEVPLEDPRTFELLRAGATQGLALLERPRVREALRREQPSDMQSLVRTLANEATSRNDDPPTLADILLATRCAAIKAHDPSAFYAAALTLAAEDAVARMALLEEARAMDIEVRPLDINCSIWEWAPEGHALRAGFSLLRDFTSAAAREVLSVRREMTFSDLADLLSRTEQRSLRTPHVEALVRAGALDQLNPSRQALLDALPALDEVLRPPRRRAAGDPNEFFGNGSGWWIRNQMGMAPEAVAVEGEPYEWLAEQERAATGMTLCADAEFLHDRFFRRARLVSPRRLRLKDRDSDVSLAGVIGGIERDPSCDGLWLAELGGCTLRVREPLADFLQGSDARSGEVVATGRLVREGFQWYLETATIGPLESLAQRSTRATCVEVDAIRLDPARQKQLLALLREFPGSTPVRLPMVPADCPRALAKIGSRQVTLCPLLEWGVSRLIPSTSWRVHVPAGA